MAKQILIIHRSWISFQDHDALSVELFRLPCIYLILVSTLNCVIIAMVLQSVDYVDRPYAGQHVPYVTTDCSLTESSKVEVFRLKCIHQEY